MNCAISVLEEHDTFAWISFERSDSAGGFYFKHLN